MLEGVAGERGVVGLDIEFEVSSSPWVLRKATPAATSKSYWCLVGSLGFRLDEELALKPMALRSRPPCAGRRPGVPVRRLRSVLEQGFVALATAQKT